MNEMTSTASPAMTVFEWLLPVVLGLLVFSGFYLHGPFFSGRPELAELVHLVSNYSILGLLVVKVYLKLLGINKGFRKVGKWANRGLLIVLFGLVVPEFLLSASLFTGAKPFAELFKSILGGLAGMYMIHYFMMWLLFSAFSVYIYLSLVEVLPRFRNPYTGDVVESGYRK